MRKMPVIMMFLFAWGLAACGSSNVASNVIPPSGSDSSGEAVPTTPSVTLNVTMTDDSFDSPTYTVPAGATVIVNVSNRGDAPHSFDILKKGEQLDTYQEADADKILWQLDVPARESGSGTFTAPTESGEYQVICRVPGHLVMGMTATLIVK